MKTFNHILFALFILTLFGACEKSTFNKDLSPGDSANLKIEERGEHHVAFRATFFTKRDTSEAGVGICSIDFPNYNHQVGGGTGTHLGKFDVTIFFCGGSFGAYADGYGTLVAANGDELYISIAEGQVYPIQDPFYELQFHDAFEFIGGTGRFEDASGFGYTNSFVNLVDDNGVFIHEHQTDHAFTGTLILP